MDQRMFELACGGLLVGVLRICHTLPIPLFNKSVPGGDRTTLDKVALFFRDSCREEVAIHGHFVRLVKNLAISAAIRGILKTDPIHVFGCNLIKDMFFSLDAVQYLKAGPYLVLGCVGVMFPFGAFVLIGESRLRKDLIKFMMSPLDGRGARRWLRPVFSLWRVLGSVTLILGAAVSGIWTLMLLLMILVGWCEQFMYDLGVSYSQNLAVYPLDAPCPQLTWKDKYVDHVLWLG
ncbi:hypothetical protein B0T21DRAFT_171473 [Apiosordaria backusii]|uniref:Uncharacterized protein n=1 Tax=Apiosordaria backusii TaxID=314023 RepID=A0AA40BKL0_9PEZI|nr:hypothetical protein B0T21DRAFT_171473 [Apiosordaria backusii]